MQFPKSSFAVAALALMGALPAQTLAQSLPPPTSGTLAAWFKAPLGGQTVSGTLSLDKCYVKGFSVAQVRFFLDSTALNTDSNVADGMSCVLDTTRFSNGTHMLRAVAYDRSGRSYTERVSINIQNGATTPAPPANTPPTVSITSPAANQSVSGALNYAADAIDNAGVSRVEFRLDGSLIASDTAAPYGGSLASAAPGTHTLTATAYDAAGLSSTSSVSFTVPQPTTPPPGTTLPAPTSGPISAWFKAPLGGQTVSGSLALDKCYIKGTGVSRVSFFLDNTALNADTNVADGMSCVLDTTRFPNGTHELRAMAYDSSGRSYHERISINIQNSGSTNPPPVENPPPTNPPPTSPPPTSSLPSTGVRAVPTFESVGLYWTPGSNPGSAGCQIQYKAADESTWRQGLALWYDSRNSECRGSVVHLKPGTDYEIQLGLPGQPMSRGIVTKTWSEQFPIARTVHVQPGQTLNITQGGSADGYVLYTPAPGTSGILDAQNGQDHSVRISAPYVIVRGFTLRGARMDAVRMYPGARDVVIERNDISNWGRSRSGNLGVDGDSAVRAICSSSFQLERTVVQDNNIHEPRYGSNSWSSGHPMGPQGITYSGCGANHVFRYNRITSVSGKYYNDIIGGGTNFSNIGFPFADTDIYGNYLANAFDDGIEAEGGNRNVRVWGNYIDDTYIGVASTVTQTGPLFVFRNVTGRTGTFGKNGEAGGYGGGRRYFFHNTILQNGGGASAGIKGNTGQPLTNSVTRNNVLHLSNAGGMAIGVIGGSANDFDYDLSNGNMAPYSGAQRNGIVGTPLYASGSGSGASGMYHLAPSSRGYDRGARIPNFNDAFSGAAPDMGAHEAGAPQMRFGPR